LHSCRFLPLRLNVLPWSRIFQSETAARNLSLQVRLGRSERCHASFRVPREVLDKLAEIFHFCTCSPLQEPPRETSLDALGVCARLENESTRRATNSRETYKSPLYTCRPSCIFKAELATFLRLARIIPTHQRPLAIRYESLAIVASAAPWRDYLKNEKLGERSPHESRDIFRDGFPCDISS
jgi:hypothetical protein